MGRALGLFRDPLHTVLLLGGLTGLFVALVVPHFGGIDETAHFYRSYQLSTGTLVPEKPVQPANSFASRASDVANDGRAYILSTKPASFGYRAASQWHPA